MSGLPHELVMYTIGSQPGLAALAFASSVMNVGHWAPNGTAMITSGALLARLATCACGGADWAASMVCSSTISNPNSSDSASKASAYA